MPDVRVLFGLCLLLLASACSERPPAPTAPFEAGSAEDAVHRVRSFLDAYMASDVEQALSHLCERDPRTRAFLERSLAPGSPFRIESYDIKSATPLWERKQPLHLVLVELPRRSGTPVEHAYRVRAEDGCIERLFGSMPERPSPHVRPPHPRVPPLDPHHRAPRDKGEPGKERGGWGPSLPAAPTKPGDEIIDL